MTDMTRQTIRLAEGDDTVLKYLGAAVVLQWHNLPEPVQKALLQQAESTGGLQAATKLHSQITSLIERSRSYA
ncbi:MAG: hypothetical protein RO009_14555 [Pseudorhodoplanes sp.]|nr:hypothetical protein [Pseudorhodoplanes sp.]